MVGSKHIATFLLGAAAGFAAYKYMTMTDEEKEKLAATLKEKANKLKEHAMQAEGQATDYFNELKAKGTDAVKEHWPKVEEFFNSIFKESPKEEAAGAATSAV
jgi:septation ring formation regulator EzrA